MVALGIALPDLGSAISADDEIGLFAFCHRQKGPLLLADAPDESILLSFRLGPPNEKAGVAGAGRGLECRERVSGRYLPTTHRKTAIDPASNRVTMPRKIFGPLMNANPHRQPPGQAKHPHSLREEARWLYILGRTFAEIAEELGVPMRTVQSWKRRSRPKWQRPPPTHLGPGGPHLETSPFATFFEGTSMAAQRVGAWLPLLPPEELRLVQNAVLSVRDGAANGTVRARQRLIDKLASYPIWEHVRRHCNDVHAAAATMAEVRGLGPGPWAVVREVFQVLDSLQVPAPSEDVKWERTMPGIRQ